MKIVFFSPVVIIVKKYNSVKVADYPGKLNDNCMEVRRHMPNIEKLLHQFR